MKIELSEKIYGDIKEYCRVNNIDDVDKFINKIVNQGFATEKWGVIGNNTNTKKEIVEKIIISAITTEPEIKIVEKIVEKIVLSSTTNEITKVINTGDSINYIYNVYVKPEKPKVEIKKSNDNIDLYGERNIRKT